MTGNPEQNASREFSELGVEKVRSGLMTGRWDGARRLAARQWLERFDARAWQEKRADKPSESRPFIARLRGAKWWRYATTVVFILMGLGLVLRRFY